MSAGFCAANYTAINLTASSMFSMLLGFMCGRMTNRAIYFHIMMYSIHNYM